MGLLAPFQAAKLRKKKQTCKFSGYNDSGGAYKQRPHPEDVAFGIRGSKDLRHAVDLAREAGLQVGSLVAVDDICLGQFVEHFLHGGIELRSFFLIGHGTQFAHGVAHCLGVILVVKLALLVLADSFEG